MYKTAKKKLSQQDFDLYNDLEQIKSALSHAAIDVKGKAGEVFNQSLEDVKDKTSRLQNSVSDYVVEQPVKTLGLTLLIGMTIGYLLHK